MKKCMLIAVITVFMVVSVGAFCSADSRRGVANTSKKGSLLIYPLVKVSPSEGGNDTIIHISNDYTARAYLNCRWQTPYNCDCREFDISLTANQSIAFSAKTGMAPAGQSLPSGTNPQPFPNNGQSVGELRCWAVKGKGSNNAPISWNHLAGKATVIEGDNQTWEYSAWRFAVGYGVNFNGLVPNATVGSDYAMRLTGMPTTYDACPEKLIFNFIRQAQDPGADEYESPRVENRLTLVPCKQDCVSTPVRVRIDTSDENEESDSAYICSDCIDAAGSLYNVSLSDPRFIDAGIFSADWRTAGRMGVASSKPRAQDCSSAQYSIPMVGVISNRFSSNEGPIAGETLTVFGRGQPYLRDDAGNDTGIEVMIKYERP